MELPTATWPSTSLQRAGGASTPQSGTLAPDGEAEDPAAELARLRAKLAVLEQQVAAPGPSRKQLHGDPSCLDVGPASSSRPTLGLRVAS